MKYDFTRAWCKKQGRGVVRFKGKNGMIENLQNCHFTVTPVSSGDVTLYEKSETVLFVSALWHKQVMHENSAEMRKIWKSYR